MPAIKKLKKIPNINPAKDRSIRRVGIGPVSLIISESGLFISK